MIRWFDISDAQAREAVTHGEFTGAVAASAENVAIILTQSWCSQWLQMNRMLKSAEKPVSAAIDIHVFIYDRSPLFREFLAFKEDILQNSAIPYVRYYRQGRLVAESNYVDDTDFFERLGV